MMKDLRCLLNLQHKYVRRHAADAESPSAYYLECTRCGKFKDIPYRPPASFIGV